MATTYLAILDPTSAAGQYFRDHSLHDGLTQIDGKSAPLIQCGSIEYKDGMATLNRRPGVKVPRFMVPLATIAIVIQWINESDLPEM